MESGTFLTFPSSFQKKVFTDLQPPLGFTGHRDQNKTNAILLHRKSRCDGICKNASESDLLF